MDRLLKKMVLLALGGRYKQTAICWLTPGMIIFIAKDSKWFWMKRLSFQYAAIVEIAQVAAYHPLP